MITKDQKIIAYLDRQKLVIIKASSEKGLVLDLPISVVFDIEVVDYDSLNFILASFVEQNKIEPTNVILVLAPAVYYEKDIGLSNNPENQKSTVEAFLKDIPYKNLLSKEYLIENGKKVVAVNKNFYEPVVMFFEKNDFNVVSIIPYFCLENNKLKLTEFSGKEAKEVVSRYKLLEPLSLATSQEIDKSVSTVSYQPKEKSARTVLLLIGFSFLFVLLLVLLYFRAQTMNKMKNKSYITTVTNTPTKPVETPTMTPTPPIEYIKEENIRIEVVNSSGVANMASKVKKILNDLNFEKVSTSTSSVTYSQKSQVVFSPQVSTETRIKIKVAVEAVLGEIDEISTGKIPNGDVLITITAKTNE